MSMACRPRLDGNCVVSVVDPSTPSMTVVNLALPLLLLLLVVRLLVQRVGRVVGSGEAVLGRFRGRVEAGTIDDVLGCRIRVGFILVPVAAVDGLVWLQRRVRIAGRGLRTRDATFVRIARCSPRVYV